MTSVINFEYFISPLICSDVDVNDYVEGMMILKEVISSSDIDIKSETLMLLKMAEEGFFPCDRLLSGAFPKGDSCVFSPQDVVKLINGILLIIDEFDSQVISHEIEWDNFEVSPSVNSVSDKRKVYFISFLRDLMLRNKLSEGDYSIFYNQADEFFSMSNGFSLRGVVGESYPILPEGISSVCACEVKTYTNAWGFLKSIDSLMLYSEANNDVSLKCAIFCGCLSFIDKNNLSCVIGWEDFSIGHDFLASLIRNQSGGNQQFSSVVFETIVHVLCRKPKSSVNKFRESGNSREQLILDGLKAFRTHVTEGHQALRLMFWVGSDKRIILANVGPKFEVSISRP
jgi:hypothetical protein